MFKLTFVRENDLDFLNEIRTDPEVQVNLGTVLFTNKEKQKEWFCSMCKNKTKMYFVFEESGLINEKLGYVRITKIDYVNRSVCIGGDIHKSYRGKGYSKKMYDLIFDLCFNKLNMNKVYLWVLCENKRAIHIYNKLGFVESGKSRQAIYRDGKYLDYIFMDFLRSEYYSKEKENGK